MHAKRAFGFGVIGAAAISVVFLGFRPFGVGLGLEILIGTLLGIAPGPAAYVAGLVVHLAIGGAFGLVYGWLFERVWMHGGTAMGVILASLHALLIGMAVGLTPIFHPLVPGRLPDPGAYFSREGVLGVIAFFGAHLVYGAIVGRGYGHVAGEREWGVGAAGRS